MINPYFLFPLTQMSGLRGLSGVAAVTHVDKMADKLGHVSVYLATGTAWAETWRPELAPSNTALGC